VVASSAVVVKDLRRRGAHSDEHVVGVVFAYAQDPPVQVEASPGLGVGALYITLPGRAVVVDHGNICGLLTECLKNVSFAALALRIAASYCFVPDSRLFFDSLFL
jgi:hypothetical protein